MLMETGTSVVRSSTTFVKSSTFHRQVQDGLPPPPFFPSVVTINIQYYTWMLPFLQSTNNSFVHLWTVTENLVFFTVFCTYILYSL
jgi:hypothetical protein